MYPTTSMTEKINLFFKLFFPILIYQFANFSASAIDTMMTGRYSTVDLAGVSTAVNLWNPFFSLLTGIVSALVPIIGHQLGSSQRDKVRSELYQFIYLGLILSIVLWLLMRFGAVEVLGYLNLEEHVANVGKEYLIWLSVGILPLILFSVFRSFFDVLGLTRLSMYLMLLLVPFNSFFNYALIYGKFGFPEMGGAGAGLGTAFAYWLVLLLVILVLVTNSKLKVYQVWKISPLNLKKLSTGFKLGLPIGLQIFAEVAIFAVVGLLMAKFSSQVISAHQAAMNFATLMYAFPVSISMTMPIAISYEMGAKRYQSAKDFARIGRSVSLVFACGTLLFLYFFRNQVAMLYGSDSEFIKLTASFLVYSFYFQIADAFAAPIQGILRGYKDTTMPFIIGVTAYWSVALPIAWLLDYLTNMGPYAYWIGLTLGIGCAGLLLHFRLKKIEKRYAVIEG